LAVPFLVTSEPVEELGKQKVTKHLQAQHHPHNKQSEFSSRLCVFLANNPGKKQIASPNKKGSQRRS
jgi:hypothetical protein